MGLYRAETVSSVTEIELFQGCIDDEAVPGDGVYGYQKWVSKNTAKSEFKEVI